MSELMSEQEQAKVIFVPTNNTPVDNTKAMSDLMLSLKNVDTSEKFKLRKLS